MGKLHLSIISFIMLISASMTAWGVVNQNIGIPDTQFQPKIVEDCWKCHEPYGGGSRPTFADPYVDDYLRDLHHQHTGTAIAGGAEQPPYMDADGDLVEDTVYSCANCHFVCPPGAVCPAVVIELDCLDCHIVEDDALTVHHDTLQAREGECAACHGGVVTNLDAGQAPPTGSPTETIPWPSNKSYDPDRISLYPSYPGNCDYCHNAWDLNSSGDVFVDISLGGSLPRSFGPITVYPNAETHHGTGLPRITDSSKGSPCFWCHPEDANFPENERIRICERCHDMPSLHSIQHDADGNGVVPGFEPSNQGHIGNAEDCWGCHGYDESQTEIPLSLGSADTTATIPQLENISALTWKEGTELEMTLSGSGFINQGGLDNGVTYRPTVQLTDSEGNATVLSPTAESVNSVQVAIPGLLPAGNYLVQIKKDDKLSNPLGATITPTINVRPGGAICLSQYRVVILRGAGFNTYTPSWPSQVTGIIGDGVDASRLFLWREGMIAARFTAGCPGTVTVNNVFDSVTLTPEIR